MYQEVLRFAPENWDVNTDQIENLVVQTTEEFNQISYEIKQAVGNYRVTRLTRIQNIHDLGQLLLREQYLATTNQDTYYYRMRKYIMLNRSYLYEALTYNLDPRRCGLSEIVFRSNLTHVDPNDLVIVVQVVTSSPYDDITPELSTQYYIEYYAEIRH